MKTKKSFLFGFFLLLVMQSLASDDSVLTDCQGNKYPVVKIGDQYWMGENLRCSKYDTESERAGQVIPHRLLNAPYYINASDKKYWIYNDYAIDLSTEQIDKLGFLYNWTAAFGAPTIGEKEYVQSVSGNKRQGICPNGWHLPKKNEWMELVNYIEQIECHGDSTAGKYLKSQNGWYSRSDDSRISLDGYGFSALPAGNGDLFGGSISVNDVGRGSAYICADDCAFEYMGLSYHADDAFSPMLKYPYSALSVRCVKDYVNGKSEIVDKTVTDCQGNVYPIVKIGSQFWMAENLRCSRYDTFSEMAGKEIPTANEEIYSYYYFDVSDINNWNYKSDTLAGNFTPLQIKRFGFLYNWTAAVGVGNVNTKNKTSKTPCQGVCPNGWHIPSLKEWRILAEQIEQADRKAFGKVGKYLISQKGWRTEHLGWYGFSALPVGNSGYSFMNIGNSTHFWVDRSQTSILLSEKEKEEPIFLSAEIPTEIVPAPGDTIKTNKKEDNLASNIVFSSDVDYGVFSSQDKTGSVRCVKNDKVMERQIKPVLIDSLSDCQGNTYPIVKIGNQYWMAENLRCTKYDTQSERAGEILNEQKEDSSEPCFYSNNSIFWREDFFDSRMLVPGEFKFGLWYNWSAAVGTDGSIDISTPRQGICPNGWHIPSRKEWMELVDYIEITDNKGKGMAGKYLKTQRGWYWDHEDDSGNYGKYEHAVDSYGFSILPANVVHTVFPIDNDNYYSVFWTVSSEFGMGTQSNSNSFYSVPLGGFPRLISLKSGASVRCVKNDVSIKKATKQRQPQNGNTSSNNIKATLSK